MHATRLLATDAAGAGWCGGFARERMSHGLATPIDVPIATTGSETATHGVGIVTMSSMAMVDARRVVIRRHGGWGPRAHAMLPYRGRVVISVMASCDRATRPGGRSKPRPYQGGGRQRFQGSDQVGTAAESDV